MAGVNVGTAWVTIAASAKGISKGIEKDLKGAGTRAGSRFGSEFDKSASSATSSLSSFGATAIVGAAAVGAAFFGLASAAGDLSAAVAANEQVLGDASQAIQDFAATGVESVGLSETAILNAATSFGQLGKVVGLTGKDLSNFSLDLVTLAADMAAFKNVTPTQALEDLQSAFAGQPEVLRKYGVFLDEGTLKQALFAATGERVTGVLTPQQRILATNAELFRQTADIQGQAAREADGFERSVANLKATVSNIAADFGAPVVGFASTLLSTLGGGLETVGKFNDDLGGMLGAGLGAGIGILAAGAGAAGVVGKVKDAAKWFGNLSKGMQLTTGILGGLALAVTAGFIAYGLMTQHSREVAARTNEVGAALNDATEEAFAFSGILDGSATAADGFAIAQHALSIALTTTGEDGEALTQTLGTLGIQSEDAFTTLFDVATRGEDALADIAEQAGHTAQEADVLAAASTRIGADWPIGGARAQEAIAGIAKEFGLTADSVTRFLAGNREFLTGLDQITEAANGVDLEDLATTFLNDAVAASEDTEALVRQAEERAAGNEIADSSVDTYNQLVAILAEMPPAQREAALEALGLADAQGEAAGSMEEVTSVAASTIDMTTDLEDAMSDAAREADAFNSALDRLVGTHLTYQEAGDQLAAGIAELDEQIRLAQEGEEGYSLSLDGSTESGRDNREMIRSRIDDVLGMADAELEAGHGIDAAAVSLQEQRNALIDQIAPFFDTRQAAEDYINTLGLTPEAVVTAVELAQEEQAKIDVEEHIAALGEIPEDVATMIQALIDQGKYDEALRLLHQLEMTRHASLFVHTVTVGGRSTAVVDAFGAYIPGNHPQFHLMGEAPWDEAVITVGNLRNLREQLTDPRISGPILEAMPQVETTSSHSGSRRRSRGDVNVISYDQNPTPAGVATALRMAGVS